MDQHRVAQADTDPILPKALPHGEGTGAKADNAGADLDRARPKALAQIADLELGHEHARMAFAMIQQLVERGAGLFVKLADADGIEMTIAVYVTDPRRDLLAHWIGVTGEAIGLWLGHVGP